MIVHTSIKKGIKKGEVKWDETNAGSFIEDAFEHEEEICFALFTGMTELHQALNTSDIFEGAYGQKVDTAASNGTGGTEFFELKLRKKEVLKYKDIFIEPEKYDFLKKLYSKMKTPVFYLNFVLNSEKVYMFNMGKVKYWKKYEGIKVESRTSPTGYDIVDRYGLNKDDAYILDREGRVIREPINRKMMTAKTIKKVDLDLEMTTKDRNIINRI